MISAYLTSSRIDLIRYSTIATAMTSHFNIIYNWSETVGCGPNGDIPRIHLTNRHLPEPYRVAPHVGAVVSLWDSSGICQYAGLDESDYVILCSLQALSQWRVLRANPLIRPEDFAHPSRDDCVYDVPSRFQDYALRLDEPTLCPGCLDFYHCLGADSEIVALHQALESIRSRQSQRGSTLEFDSDFP